MVTFEYVIYVFLEKGMISLFESTFRVCSCGGSSLRYEIGRLAPDYNGNIRAFLTVKAPQAFSSVGELRISVVFHRSLFRSDKQENLYHRIPSALWRATVAANLRVSLCSFCNIIHNGISGNGLWGKPPLKTWRIVVRVDVIFFRDNFCARHFLALWVDISVTKFSFELTFIWRFCFWCNPYDNKMAWRHRRCRDPSMEQWGRKWCKSIAGKGEHEQFFNSIVQKTIRKR